MNWQLPWSLQRSSHSQQVCTLLWNYQYAFPNAFPRTIDRKNPSVITRLVFYTSLTLYSLSFFYLFISTNNESSESFSNPAAIIASIALSNIGQIGGDAGGTLFIISLCANFRSSSSHKLIAYIKRFYKYHLTIMTSVGACLIHGHKSNVVPMWVFVSSIMNLRSFQCMQFPANSDILL